MYGLYVKFILKLKKSKLMIVFGSGGHTTEMLLMLKGLNFNKYDQITFIIGHSDTWSMNKIRDFYQKYRNVNIEKDFQNLRILRLFRSREIKQSYITSILTNGPGTAVPLCYARCLISKLLRINPEAKIVFVESFCRVTSLSLTGKLLKPIADKQEIIQLNIYLDLLYNGDSQ
ncbi:UNKNOWN [Stylonychia lemnae]|uniref:UDP-N-acetylglucosamine transferase subunit ALG14 n=1 Tax=Stylonychia lemnae TaxID=5949 RepID=A0A078AGX1_STYLE|nr:UNKNOWN [Stylonychia lemnae]|eukprot:CDW80772.1 UNKNOWN [Stylonychia lemnae]